MWPDAALLHGSRKRPKGQPAGARLGLKSRTVMPFKLNAKGRAHIPRARYKVRNWRAYDEALRNRGSLTIWFTPEALADWRARPRTTRGGQALYSAVAIETALTLRCVFRLGLRQAEGLMGSIMAILGVDLPVPDHSTLSRRACGLSVPRWPRQDSGGLHLIVDSTGLRLRGAGEWLSEKHGTIKRRAWRKLHIGLDAATGEIACFELTDKDVDDAGRIEALLQQVDRPLEWLMGDGAYDADGARKSVRDHSSGARYIAPPRKGAALGPTAGRAPTQRDRDIQMIQAHGRMHWQKLSGYNRRSRIEAELSRFKRVIGDGLRSRHDERRTTEVKIAVKALNRMTRLGRPDSVKIA